MQTHVKAHWTKLSILSLLLFVWGALLPAYACSPEVDNTVAQLQKSARAKISANDCLAQVVNKTSITANESGQSEPPIIQSNAPRQNTSITFKELIRKIEDFTRSNKSILKNAESEDTFTVTDRILIGFQQFPPRKLQLADGTTIMWGWQHQQAFLKSIAIFDNNNRVRMVGFADNLPLIYSTSTAFGDTVVTNLTDYEALLERRLIYSSPPVVHLYAATQEDVGTYYPLVARWVQAAMMGFNSECSEQKQLASCRFAETIRIPTYIHTRDCPYSDESHPKCDLNLPSAVSSAVPSLDDFRQ